MKSSRAWSFALLAAISILRPGQADAHTDTDVLEAKERLLPGDELPAWRSLEERGSHMPRRRAPAAHRMEDRLLPPPSLGYRVPAEFEPVAALVLTQGDWGKNEMFFDILRRGTAPGGAPAIVLTGDEEEDFASKLAAQGVDMSRVTIVVSSDGLNTKWIRDFGPISIYEIRDDDGQEGRELAFLDMHYYDYRVQDDAVPEVLADFFGASRYGLEGDSQVPPDDLKLYMEGGNYQTDGQGTCILSNDVPSDNRNKKNPDADTFEEVEGLLARYLGCEQIIWLRPLPNSGTGHVDLYAKLLSPTDILMIDFPGSKGNNPEADAVIEENVREMERATNLYGDPYDVHRVTVPALGEGQAGWVYKSYTNAVMLNRVVLVPTYDAPDHDGEALRVYEEVLGPDFEVVGIPSSSIAAQGGAVHCTTMQIASVCGNGRLDPLFEDCDGEDLAGQTCRALGLPEGELECGADCRFDTRPCGRREPEELEDTDSSGSRDSASFAEDDTSTEDTAAESPPSAASAQLGCGFTFGPHRSPAWLDLLVDFVI